LGFATTLLMWGMGRTADGPLHEQTKEAPAKYEATLESLNKHPLPEWYADAKLGIFIHWGLYSVPGWAVLTPEGTTPRRFAHAGISQTTLRRELRLLQFCRHV
jgi:alpha-L-fucosidase